MTYFKFDFSDLLARWNIVNAQGGTTYTGRTMSCNEVARYSENVNEHISTNCIWQKKGQSAK